MGKQRLGHGWGQLERARLAKALPSVQTSLEAKSVFLGLVQTHLAA